MFNYTTLYSGKYFNKFKSVILWKFPETLYLNSRTKTHYEILNVSRNCTAKEIREAFITLSKQCHPDKNKDNPKAQEQFVKVKEAYNVLIKPESRRDYDFNLPQNYSRVAEGSADKGGYYEVHRYNPYNDPWKDPSFARNRDFSRHTVHDDRYYGVKGVNKKTNNQILLWIMMFFSAAMVIQIFVIRFSVARQAERLQRISEENSRVLENVKARAASYGSRERQMEEILWRFNNQKRKE